MNVNVRTQPGIDGPLVMGAFCATCEQESQPSTRGLCMWCDRLIYQPSGGAVGDLPAPPRPRMFPAKGVPLIASADIVLALQALAADLGRAPNSHEWLIGSVPSLSTVLRRFGSWRNALVAAGLT